MTRADVHSWTGFSALSHPCSPFPFSHPCSPFPFSPPSHTHCVALQICFSDIFEDEEEIPVGMQLSVQPVSDFKSLGSGSLWLTVLFASVPVRLFVSLSFSLGWPAMLTLSSLGIWNSLTAAFNYFSFPWSGSAGRFCSSQRSAFVLTLAANLITAGRQHSSPPLFTRQQFMDHFSTRMWSTW